MIEVPEDYSFDTPSNCYELEVIDEEEFVEEGEDTVAMEYGGNPDPLDTEKHYTSISVENQLDDNQDPEDLKERYRRNIKLKDLIDEDRLLINCMNRQLERLYYCIENSDYKLLLMCKKYMSIYNGSEFICYKIRNYRDYSDKRQYFFSTSMKPLLKESNIVENNFLQLTKGVQSIIEKNHSIHSKNLKTIIEKNIQIDHICEKIGVYKQKIKAVIDAYRQIFNKLREAEQKILNMMQEESVKIPGQSIGEEMKRNQGKYKHLENINKIRVYRGKIQEILTGIKKRYDHIILLSDKILFDNIVMINRIFKNFDIFKDMLDNSEISF